jgi:hypothetical protein
VATGDGVALGDGVLEVDGDAEGLVLPAGGGVVVDGVGDGEGDGDGEGAGATMGMVARVCVRLHVTVPKPCVCADIFLSFTFIELPTGPVASSDQLG